MNKLIDETGNRHNKLVVIEYAGSNRWGNTTWLCQCDCGNQVIVRGSNLRRGDTKSCGCLHAERIRETIWIPWNEKFFDVLNPDVAYIIGFFIADGNIEGQRAGLGFSQKNPIPLWRIAKLIDYEGDLHTQKENNYALRLTSQHAVETLINKYKIPRGYAKSYEVRIPPAIPDELLPHLIRGYFDGDGCICIDSNPIYIKFSSSSSGLMDDINDILTTYIDMPLGRRSKGKYIKKNGQKTESHELQWIRQSDIMKFAKYIYGPERNVYGSDLFLRRKKKLFDSLFVPWRNHDWLYQEYVKRGRSKRGIAKEFGLYTESIRYWIDFYGLETERTKYWNLNLDI